MKGFRGVWGVHRGSPGGQEGSLIPPTGSFVPSGSLVWHQIWFQTPHNGLNGQCLQGTSLTHFWTFGPHLGAPNGPFHEQNKPFSGSK